MNSIWRAAQAAADAEATDLANVRDQHLRAQATWLQMADRTQQMADTKAATEAHKASLAAAS
jgi:hypothetical protein